MSKKRKGSFIDRGGLPIKEIISEEQFGVERMQKELRRAVNQTDWRERLAGLDNLRNVDHPLVHRCIVRLALHDQATIVKRVACNYATMLGLKTQNGNPIVLKRMGSMFVHISLKKLHHHLVITFNKLKDKMKENEIDYKTFRAKYKDLYKIEYDFLSGRLIKEEAIKEFFRCHCLTAGLKSINWNSSHPVEESEDTDQSVVLSNVQTNEGE